MARAGAHEGDEQAELAHRERERSARGRGEAVARADLQDPEAQDVGSLALVEALTLGLLHAGDADGRAPRRLPTGEVAVNDP